MSLALIIDWRVVRNFHLQTVSLLSYLLTCFWLQGGLHGWFLVHEFKNNFFAKQSRGSSQRRVHTDLVHFVPILLEHVKRVESVSPHRVLTLYLDLRGISRVEV